MKKAKQFVTILMIAVIFVLCFSTAQADEQPNDLWGDVDQNGIVNAEDALLILRRSAQLLSVSVYDAYLVDFNYNLHIDAEDALIVLKKAAKLVDELPYSEDYATMGKEKYQDEALADIKNFVSSAVICLDEESTNENNIYGFDVEKLQNLNITADDYDYTLARISNFIITDLNHDGIADIVFVDTSEQGKLYIAYMYEDSIELCVKDALIRNKMVFLYNFTAAIDGTAIMHSFGANTSASIDEIYLETVFVSDSVE